MTVMVSSGYAVWSSETKLKELGFWVMVNTPFLTSSGISRLIERAVPPDWYSKPVIVNGKFLLESSEEVKENWRFGEGWAIFVWSSFDENVRTMAGFVLENLFSFRVRIESSSSVGTQ